MKERVVDNRYDPLVWLGRKIFRRDQVEHTSLPHHTPHEPSPRRRAGRAAGGAVAPAAAAARCCPRSGPDGRLPLTEITFDRAGAASPFGDDVTFPLPADTLTYQHPAHDRDGQDAGHH